MTFLKNKKLLSIIYLGSAATTILSALFILVKHPSLLALSLNISAIIAMTATTVPLFFRFDIFKLVRMRTYSDHLIIGSAVLFQTASPSFIYFYVIVIWIQSFVNIHVLDNDHRVGVFLKVTPLIVCICSYTFLWKTPLVMYLFSFGVVASLFLFYSMERSLDRHKSLEKAAQAVKDVHYRILIHNIRNQSNQLLLKLSKNYPELENQISATFEQIITSVGGITEESKAKTDIFLLVNRMAAYFSVNYSVKFSLHLRSTPAMLYEQLFLSALYSFFSNSHEAGASRIKISKEKDLLVIEDNGCGFDTTKIQRGYTTKQNGRGIGLVSALEACEKTGIQVKIDSKIGSGTKITLNLAGIVVSS